MMGPGGSVTIGDTLDQAKNAFPLPKGAQTFDSSMSFAIVTKEGWSWASEAERSSFEAGTKSGKIVALGVSSGAPMEGALKEITDQIGEPARKAEGKTASAYVWESGENARFLVLVRDPLPLMPFTRLDLIGRKDDLKLLNYRAEDPASFVAQLDAATEQMKSGEAKEAFEDAKRKAKSKT
jgi:hypothetical protein